MTVFDAVLKAATLQERPQRQIPTVMAHMPPSAWQADLAAQQRIDAEEAADAEERLKAAIEADERDYANTLLVRTQGWRESDPPSATDLGVSVEGLGAARAMLVRVKAWLDQTKAERSKLEAARERYYDQLGAVAVTQRELDALIAQDKSGFLAWLKAGAHKDSKPEVSTFRRQQIEALLVEQTHEAEVARHGLAALDDEITVLAKAVEILEGRLPHYAQAALAEAAKPLLNDYQVAVDRVRELATEIGGLVRTAPGQGVFDGPALRQINIDVPAFGDVRRSVVHEAQIDAAAAPWRERERALISNPRADITRKGKPS